jgi:hypothetical protein
MATMHICEALITISTDTRHNHFALRHSHSHAPFTPDQTPKSAGAKCSGVVTGVTGGSVLRCARSTHRYSGAALSG